MAAVLYRYAKLKGYHTAAAGNLVGFSDAGDVSVYAVDPAKWAVGNGLISGVGNNMLAPGASSTTRADRCNSDAFLQKYHTIGSG